MKKLTFPLLTATLLLLAIGCTPVYRPSAVNLPMFDTANELQVGGYIGNNGTDVQAAYSIDDKYAIVAAGSFMNFNDNNSDSFTLLNTVRRHSFGELGLGYYEKFGRNGVFEIYGGFGAGKSEAQDIFDGDSISAQGNFFKLFMQPSISFKSNNFQFGLVTRFSYINFTRYTDDFLANTNNLDLDAVFIEPAFQIGFGAKNFRFTWQTGFSVPFNTPDFRHNPFISNIGLRFIIPEVR